MELPCCRNFDHADERNFILTTSIGLKKRGSKNKVTFIIMIKIARLRGVVQSFREGTQSRQKYLYLMRDKVPEIFKDSLCVIRYIVVAS